MTEAVNLLASPRPLRAAPGGVPARGGAAAEAALAERLGAAERAARAGRLDNARRLCAAAILDHQPLLAGSAPLLRQAIVALLYCRAFQQLARLLAAVQGRTVRIRLAGAAGAWGAPPDAMEDLENYVFEPSQFAGEDADWLIRRWADALVAGSSRRPSLRA